MQLLRYLIIFMLLSIGLAFGLYGLFLDKVNSQAKTEEALIHLTYSSAVENHLKLSTLFFNSHINRPEIVKLVADAYQADEVTQNQLRQKLFQKLKKAYIQNTKLFNLKQLHFHFPNNHSFLRFHRPNKFGDDLTNIRKSVKDVNEHKASVHTFEEGRIYNGYRYVFPLWYQNRHVGSVETSISMVAMTRIISRQLKSQTLFLIKKSLIEQKVMSSEQKNYISTILSEDYFLERPKKEEKRFDQRQIEQTMRKQSNDRIKALASGDKALEYTIQDNQVYTDFFYPIRNHLTGEEAAYLVVHREQPILSAALSQFWLVFFLLEFMLFFAMLSHWYYRNTKLQYLNSVSTIDEIQKVAQIGSWQYSFSSHSLIWNKQTYDIFGVEENSHISKEFFLLKIVHDDRERVRQTIDHAIENCQDYQVQFRIFMEDESIRFIEDSAHIIQDPLTKQPISIVGLTKDITEFQEYNLRFSAVVNNQNSLIMIIRNGKLDFMNQAMLDFFDSYSLESFVEAHKCICNTFVKEAGLFYLDTPQTNAAFWLSEIQKLPEFARKVSMTDQFGVTRIFMVDSLPYESGEFIVYFNDITFSQLENKMLSHQADHDKLTNVLNRNFLEKYYPSMANEVRDSSDHYFALFDIDHFKKINDRHGHLVGDKILIEIANLVKRHTRSEDKLVRWGGEEFLLIFESNSDDSAITTVENLRQRIEEYDFPEVGNVTCSFGISKYQAILTLEALIRIADQTLYQSKQNGRNQVTSQLNGE